MKHFERHGVFYLLNLILKQYICFFFFFFGIKIKSFNLKNRFNRLKLMHIYGKNKYKIKKNKNKRMMNKSYLFFKYTSYCYLQI